MAPAPSRPPWTMLHHHGGHHDGSVGEREIPWRERKPESWKGPALSNGNQPGFHMNCLNSLSKAEPPGDLVLHTVSTSSGFFQLPHLHTHVLASTTQSQTLSDHSSSPKGTNHDQRKNLKVACRRNCAYFQCWCQAR